MPNQTECLQLFDHESYTYTYLLWDAVTREAIIIDPVDLQSERDLELINQFGLHLKYIVDTHVHGDHITAAALLKKAHPSAQYAMSKEANVHNQDIFLNDGDTLPYGAQVMHAITTPGHTNTCTSFYTAPYLFTGDTLLIGGCGRTDFQEGNPETLFASIQKLYQLPGDTIVYPGHDYRGFTRSTIAWEKRFNKRLPGGQSKQSFIEIMHNLKLAPPKKLAEAQKWNVLGGGKPLS